MRSFKIFGKASYLINVSIMPKEFQSILPFSHNHGSWNVNNGRIEVLALQYAEAMTGSYFMRDVRVTGLIRPFNGESHLVSLRVQGTRRGYYAGFDGEGQAAIIKHDGEQVIRLAQTAFPWKTDNDYQIAFEAVGDLLTLTVDSKVLLSAQDSDFSHGMTGYALYSSGRAELGDLMVEEI